jgi:hypothetical protein
LFIINNCEYDYNYDVLDIILNIFAFSQAKILDVEKPSSISQRIIVFDSYVISFIGIVLRWAADFERAKSISSRRLKISKLLKGQAFIFIDPSSHL